MKKRHKRLALIGGGLAALGIATALVLNAFQSNLVFFFTPTQVSAGEAPQERTFRVGGMVQTGSVQRLSDGLTVKFVVTDTAKMVPVTYTGILPDLFSEGKGVVAQGKLGVELYDHDAETFQCGVRAPVASMSMPSVLAPSMVR
mgnify:CR=1 FL=1